MSTIEEEKGDADLFLAGRRIVVEDDAPGGPPAAGAAPVAGPLLPIAAGFAACYALFCAYIWATPRPGEPLAWFLVGLVPFTLWAGSYLISLAWVARPVGGLRLALPVVPLYLVAVVRAVGSATGGWAGGWALGVAGAAAGAVAGVVAGWLFTRWVLPGLRKYRG